MLSETSLNSLIVKQGLKTDVNTYESNYKSHAVCPKKQRPPEQCPWRNQAMSIAYRIGRESRNTMKHTIQREIVTLVNNAGTEKCSKFVLAYFDKGIEHFINIVNELSRQKIHPVKNRKTAESNKK